MEKQNLEVLNTGLTDNFNILSDSEMDFIMGGNVTCKKSYSETQSTINCGCGYTIDKEPTTTGKPTNDGPTQAGGDGQHP